MSNTTNDKQNLSKGYSGYQVYREGNFLIKRLTGTPTPEKLATLEQKARIVSAIKHRVPAIAPLAIEPNKPNQFLVTNDFSGFVYPFMEGTSKKITEWTAPMYQAYGQVISNLHDIQLNDIQIETIDSDHILAQNLGRFDIQLNLDKLFGKQSVYKQYKPQLTHAYTQGRAFYRTINFDDLVLSHGDYHDDQILWHGHTFFIIDWDNLTLENQYMDILKAFCLLNPMSMDPRKRTLVDSGVIHAFAQGYAAAGLLPAVDLLPYVDALCADCISNSGHYARLAQKYPDAPGIASFKNLSTALLLQAINLYQNRQHLADTLSPLLF